MQVYYVKESVSIRDSVLPDKGDPWQLLAPQGLTTCHLVAQFVIAQRESTSCLLLSANVSQTEKNDSPNVLCDAF